MNYPIIFEHIIFEHVFTHLIAAWAFSCFDALG